MSNRYYLLIGCQEKQILINWDFKGRAQAALIVCNCIVQQYRVALFANNFSNNSLFYLMPFKIMLSSIKATYINSVDFPALY